MLSSCNNKSLHGDIEGKWLLCKMEYNGEVTMLNVCHEIVFYKESNGKIKTPSKDEIRFTYTMSSESNKIRFSFENNQSYFESKEFFYNIHTEGKLEILELSATEGKSKYILSREK